MEPMARACYGIGAQPADCQLLKGKACAGAEGETGILPNGTNAATHGSCTRAFAAGSCRYYEDLPRPCRSVCACRARCIKRTERVLKLGVPSSVLIMRIARLPKTEQT